MRKLDRDCIRRIVESALSTRPDEIGCELCFNQLGDFAERMLEGKDVPEALKLVGDHLEQCLDCHEEFEALLVALRDLDAVE